MLLFESSLNCFLSFEQQLLLLRAITAMATVPIPFWHVWHCCQWYIIWIRSLGTFGKQFVAVRRVPVVSCSVESAVDTRCSLDSLVGRVFCRGPSVEFLSDWVVMPFNDLCQYNIKQLLLASVAVVDKKVLPTRKDHSSRISPLIDHWSIHRP